MPDWVGHVIFCALFVVVVGCVVLYTKLKNTGVLKTYLQAAGNLGVSNPKHFRADTTVQLTGQLGSRSIMMQRREVSRRSSSFAEYLNTCQVSTSSPHTLYVRRKNVLDKLAPVGKIETGRSIDRTFSFSTNHPEWALRVLDPNLDERLLALLTNPLEINEQKVTWSASGKYPDGSRITEIFLLIREIAEKAEGLTQGYFEG